MSLKELVGESIAAERPRSLAEQSADKLRELILLERLPAGLPLKERELSDLLGTSRTPVRDAIRLLEIEGLVDHFDGRLRVADPSMELLTHWLMIQGALEGLAGEQACLNATDAELRHIEKLQSQMIDLAEQEDDLRRFELDMEFHCAIVAAAHNPPLVETHQQYNSRLWRARYVSAKRQANRDQQMQKHQGIVDALLERDAAEASAALISHLRNAIENIKASYAEPANETDR
jgi:DNA-binding GntR family transcriptional regulator